ncbi:hypothetical protein ACLOJK_026267 [Asimina triloba]
MAATTTAGHRRCHHRRSPLSPPRCCQLPSPTMAAYLSPSTSPKKPKPRRRPPPEPTMAEHPVGPSKPFIMTATRELIPDPSRPQADVDHSGHTKRVFLAHPRMDQRQGNTDRFLLRPHLALHAHIQQICPFSPSTPKQLQQRSHETSVHHAHEKPSASSIKPAAMIQRPGFSVATLH